jgi:hypothetical protein
MVKKKRIKKTVRKKISSHTRCSNCHSIINENAKFCTHCGHNVVPHKLHGVHNCPSCKGTIEGFSRYCKHCGANIDTFGHGKFVKVLLYFILFLVLALALLIFFSPTLVNDGGYGDTSIDLGVGGEKPFLKLNNAVCNWDGSSFNLCANVNWAGKTGDYVRCGFAGNLNDKKLYSAPVTCCDNVGDKEGTKLVRGFLYDSEGNSYDDDSLSVSCVGKTKKESGIKPVPKTTTPYQKSFWFVAKPRGTPADGSGTVEIKFPSKVKSCKIGGNWVTTKAFLESEAGYCVGGKGVFYGNADFSTQNIFSDPGIFSWAGYDKHLLNPEGKLHEGKGLFMYICDLSYQTGPSHYVQAQFSGFETPTLFLDWEYYSTYPKPNVNIFVDMDCELY